MGWCQWTSLTSKTSSSSSSLFKSMVRPTNGVKGRSICLVNSWKIVSKMVSVLAGIWARMKRLVFMIGPFGLVCRVLIRW